jgi:hypothetical protein
MTWWQQGGELRRLRRLPLSRLARSPCTSRVLPKIPAPLEDRWNETRITRISRMPRDASVTLGGGRRGHGFAAEERRLGIPTESLGCGRGPRVARPWLARSTTPAVGGRPRPLSGRSFRWASVSSWLRVDPVSSVSSRGRSRNGAHVHHLPRFHLRRRRRLSGQAGHQQTRRDCRQEANGPDGGSASRWLWFRARLAQDLPNESPGSVADSTIATSDLLAYLQRVRSFRRRC